MNVVISVTFVRIKKKMSFLTCFSFSQLTAEHSRKALENGRATCFMVSVEPQYPGGNLSVFVGVDSTIVNC